MKTCITCRWCELPEDKNLIENWARCLSPRNYFDVSPISGNTMPSWNYCRGARHGADNACGKDGEWWEPIARLAKQEV